MRTRLFAVIGAAVVITAVAVSVNVRSAETNGAPRTAWGEPDLQGIWTNEFDTPLQRAARYGTREFFTEEERAELDKERLTLLGRDRRVERGTELDVAGAYNSVFMSMKRTGRAHVPDRRSAGRACPLSDTRSNAASRRRSRVPPRPAAGDRHVQEQLDGVRRRKVRCDALTAKSRGSRSV